MASALRITVHFLQPYSHGRGEDGEPEWPPSPLRLFQALVAAAMARSHEDGWRADAARALAWLECQPPPEIVAPSARKTALFRLYIPDNVGDNVAKAWSAGREASLADYRSEKDVRAVRLDGEAVHYLFHEAKGVETYLATLRATARSMTHLGWGIDMVVGDATSDAVPLTGEHWLPEREGRCRLRCAVGGTLVALERRHKSFLQRLDGGLLAPVPPLTTFAVPPYARAGDPRAPPWAAFRLLHPKSGRPLALDPARRARDVAAWTRHAVAAVCERWPYGSTEQIVHGHGATTEEAGPRARFSFLPLPTLTPQRRSGGLSRVLIVASSGLAAQLDWVRVRLGGQELSWQGTPMALLDPLPTGDWVLRQYLQPQPEEDPADDVWSTVTPVVLPGHDDRKAKKVERLLRKAFVQAGFAPELVDAIRELDWGTAGFRAGVEHALRYRRPDKIHGPLVHVRVRFAHPVVGPLAIGSGRHRGLGLFARHG